MSSAGRRRRTLWTLFPLVWLVYLIFPVSSFYGERHPAPVLVLGTLALAVFLALWGWTYSRSDRPGHERRVLIIFAWCLLLFVVGYPYINYGGITFLIYGAGVAGFQASTVWAVWATVVSVAGILAPVWFLKGVLEALTYVLFAAVAAAGNHASFRNIVYRHRLAQAQAEKEKLAQLAERERIARDLHDLLGHTLSVIVLKSELAARLAERDPARAAAEIREVEQISREALGEVRAAVRGYRGSGLNAELGRSKVALDAAGVRLEYEGEPLTLPAPVEYVMEMALREAVTNVVRHASARSCRLRLGRVGDCFELEVKDDGVGGLGPEGSGLTGMRERVRALGGELVRDGRGGTRLLVRLPARRPGRPGKVTWPPHDPGADRRGPGAGARRAERAAVPGARYRGGRAGRGRRARPDPRPRTAPGRAGDRHRDARPVGPGPGRPAAPRAAGSASDHRDHLRAGGLPAPGAGRGGARLPAQGRPRQRTGGRHPAGPRGRPGGGPQPGRRGLGRI